MVAFIVPMHRRRHRCDTTILQMIVLLECILLLNAAFAFQKFTVPRHRGTCPAQQRRRDRHLSQRHHQVLRFSSMTTTTTTTTTSLGGMWSQDDEIRGPERIKACVPYLLPLMDGDHFGLYIYERIPVLGVVDSVTIGPLADLGHNVPFLTLALFIALTLGTRFNSDMSRNLRFSAQQAALIDVALLFPELISSAFLEDPLPRYIAEPCSNFVWYGYMSIVTYCIYSNLKGKKPDQIPFLSGAAELMVGPF